MPKTVSVLNNKEGLISYIAYPNHGKRAVLADTLKDFQIHN